MSAGAGRNPEKELRCWPLAAPVPNHPIVGVVGFSDLPKSGFFKDTRRRIGVPECVRIDRTDDCILERTLNHLRYGIRRQSPERGVLMRRRALASFCCALVSSLCACEERLEVLSAADASSPPPGASFAALSAGQGHACAVRDGAVWCWGSGTRGELGNGARVARVPAPAPVSALANSTSIHAGEFHTCALDGQGTTRCWGANDQGQLGVLDFAERLQPAPVTFTPAASQLATGFLFTCAVLRDQSLWCWGRNFEGQLAQGEIPSKMGLHTPIQIGSDRDWTFVSTGQGHTCGIRAPGVLYCWGRNTEGELGLGQGASIQIRSPVRVGDDTDWLRVSAAENETCALKSNGTLWCWGGNPDGQLGLGDRVRRDLPARVGSRSDWDTVALSTFHACGLANGELWCWGRNTEGQLGTGDGDDRLAPTRIGSDRDWTSVSVGAFFTCALKTGGSAWCTGANDEGQLGVGDVERRYTLTPVVAEEAPAGAEWLNGR
jgi:alpha-tubulin suppressor-like RCC1 family protein